MPAEVYWRRRLLVLAALIGLVWVAVRFLGGGGDDHDRADPAPAATRTTTTTPKPVAPVDGVVDVSLTSGTAACDPERIRITPTVEPGQLTKGPVSIGLVVSSTEAKACTLEPADADLLAVITANGTPVYDSTVCKTPLLRDPVVISPQWASLVAVQWSGRGSGGKCSAKEGFATPGTYAVQIGTLGGEPGKATFTLEARPTPKPTKTTPTPSKKTPDAKKTPKKTTEPTD
jgi:hypothetical protein